MPLNVKLKQQKDEEAVQITAASYYEAAELFVKDLFEKTDEWINTNTVCVWEEGKENREEFTVIITMKPTYKAVSKRLKW